MYHIVIADDEQLERMAMRQALEDYFKEHCNIELAANGKEAVDAVRRIHADIAVLDIAMPGMGGIEAARSIRQAEPDCRIIFLTAYSEFSYARQAVELGAVDYLLKPCADSQLYAVMERVIGLIKSQRDEEKQQELSNRKIENLTQWLEEQLVLTVMGGYLRSDRVYDQIKELNINFCNGAFAILRSPDGVSAKRIRSMVEGCGWQVGLHLILYEYDDCLYIFAISETEKDCAQIVQERLSELSEQQLSLLHKRLYCAVGERFDDLADAQKSFYQAQTALGRCHSDNYLVCSACCNEDAPALNLEDSDFEWIICRNLMEGDLEKVINMKSVIMQGLCAQQLDCKAIIEKMGKRMRRLLRLLQNETGIDYCQKYDLEEWFADMKETKQLDDTVTAMLYELSGDVSGSRGNRMTQITQEIADYMSKNYRRDIFLQQVAQEMNYSDAYFSKLFKQCFNKNFITYLTEARIDAAKEMLRNPTINIKDISAQVGYKDSNYFTKVFRRTTGKSPSEYRSSVLHGSFSV